MEAEARVAEASVVARVAVDWAAERVEVEPWAATVVVARGVVVTAGAGSVEGATGEAGLEAVATVVAVRVATLAARVAGRAGRRTSWCWR